MDQQKHTLPKTRSSAAGTGFNDSAKVTFSFEAYGKVSATNHSCICGEIGMTDIECCRSCSMPVGLWSTATVSHLYGARYSTISWRKGS